MLLYLDKSELITLYVSLCTCDLLLKNSEIKLTDNFYKLLEKVRKEKVYYDTTPQED